MKQAQARAHAPAPEVFHAEKFDSNFCSALRSKTTSNVSSSWCLDCVNTVARKQFTGNSLDKDAVTQNIDITGNGEVSDIVSHEPCILRDIHDMFADEVVSEKELEWVSFGILQAPTGKDKINQCAEASQGATQRYFFEFQLSLVAIFLPKYGSWL